MDEEDPIGEINPIRYRSYYYDVETGLYYLRARYYDPETGRFISQDNINYLDPEHLSGLNLYAYCNDNPVMYVDPNGNLVITLSSILIGLAAGAIVGAVTGAVYGGLTAAANGQDVAAGIGIGLVAGMFMGAGAGVATAFILAGGIGVAIGAGIGFATGFIGGFFSDISNQVVNNGQVTDWKSGIMSGVQYGIINTLSAFTCALGGDLSFWESVALNSNFGFGYGAIGFFFDLIRARNNSQNSQLAIDKLSYLS